MQLPIKQYYFILSGYIDYLLDLEDNTIVHNNVEIVTQLLFQHYTYIAMFHKDSSSLAD